MTKTDFKIHKNNYNVNGTCVYRNSCDHEAFFKRTETGFTTKLRVPGFKAEPIHISIPIKDSEGFDVKFTEQEFPVESIQDTIRAYGELVNHWISMCYDLETMQLVKKAGQPLYGYLKDMEKYDELRDILTNLQ